MLEVKESAVPLFSAKKPAEESTKHGVLDAGSNTLLISEEQLQQALIKQRNSKQTLVEILTEMNLLSQYDIANIANLKVYAVPSIRLAFDLFYKDVLELIPKYFCLENKLLPLRYMDHCLTVVMADPMNVQAVERLRDMVRGDVKVVHAEEKEILDLIDKLYPEKEEEGKAEEVLLTVKEISDSVETEPEEQEDAVQRNAGPVVRLVDATLKQALDRGASDIHIEPYPKESIIRFRVDGHLVDHLRLPRRIHHPVVSRIKILGGMDIAETRRPQDGRCQVSAQGKHADLRIATIRTLHGEKVTIRILNKAATLLDLETLGFTQYNYDLIMDLLRIPQGIVLATGPTGSGKTSTLYAALSKILTPERNIVTIEDPVEYQLARVNQIQVHSKAGVTFASILRNVLRQDPDVIMVGEIRDLETAEIAIHAAQTGHLVLSTLHTNDAPSALTRLIDLGVKAFLVGGTVTGVIAQRLVRRICADCIQEYAPTTDEKITAVRKQIQLPEKLYKGEGCISCGGMGYKGRTVISEVLRVSPRIARQLLMGGSSLVEVEEIAVEDGMVPMWRDALDKCFQGITTLAEAVGAVG